MQSVQPPPLTSPTPSFRWRVIDQLVGVVLALVTFVALLNTADMGFTRDEGFYFRAGQEYLGWFDELEANMAEGRSEHSFTQPNIDKHWGYNPEHPVLMKTLFGLSYGALARDREVLSPATAMRVPTMVMVALLIWAMYLFMCEAFSRLAGVLACVALMASPRTFFHAHLACFDAAMVTLWFVVLWAYWKSLRSRRWAVATGLLFGVALLTKLNGFFLPVAMAMHWAWTGWSSFRIERSERRVMLLRMPRVPLAVAAMVVLGPLVMHWGWPRHWFDTFNRLAWYFEFHLGHVHYPVEYFGQLLWDPPFPASFPVGMSLVTTPLVLLMAFVLGMIALMLRQPVAPRLRFMANRLRATWGDGEEVLTRPYPHDARGTVILLMVGMAVPVLVIARPSTPVFGGVKHWMTAMPFASCIMGIGIAWAWHGLLATLAGVWKPLEALSMRQVLAAGLGGLMLWPAVRETAHAYRLGTGYYNELIGGERGAADRGMQRQFWGYAMGEALAWINAHADEGAVLHCHNTQQSEPKAYSAAKMYHVEGDLREDLVCIGNVFDVEGLRRVQYVLFYHQRAFDPFLYAIWDIYGDASPVYVVSLDGVAMLSVYENPSWRKPQGRVERRNEASQRPLTAQRMHR